MTAKITLLRCLSAFLDPTGQNQKVRHELISSDLDWNLFIKMARTHRVLPFVSIALQRSGVFRKLPQEVQRRMTAELWQAAAENLEKLARFRNINCLFREHKIPVIALKGIALTRLVYKKNSFRLMGDLDILVREMDYVKVRTFLEQSGFRLKEGLNRWQTALANSIIGRASYIKENLDLDLQWTPRFSAGGAMVEWNSEKSWREALPCPALGENVFVLSNLDQARYLLLQMANDCELCTPRLIQFLDLALVLKQFELSGENVLDFDLPGLPEGARKKLSDLLQTVHECFLSQDFTGSFSLVTREILDLFFRKDSSNAFIASGPSFLKFVTSPVAKAIFLAGYLFPSKSSFVRKRAHHFASKAHVYFDHWRRLLLKALGLTC